MLEISVLIPVKNEQGSLPKLIPSIIKEMKQFDVTFEVLIIDDGSTDNSVKNLIQLKEEFPQIRFISIPPKYNVPLGTAIKLGLHCAQGKFILTMDGDGSHDPFELKKFVQLYKQGKIAVVGGRYFPKQNAFFPLTRFFISKSFNFFVRNIIHGSLFDYSSGYRLFLSKIGRNLKGRDFDIHIELNLRIAKLRLHSPQLIEEIQIQYQKRKEGKSKLNYFKVLPSYLYQILIYLAKRSR